MATSTQTIETYQNGVLIGSRQATITTTPEQDNSDTLRQQATQALATNRTYVGIAGPTAAQTTAQVKALSRQVNGLIRLLLQQLDDTD